jgi:hypothetical protein
VQGDGCVRPLLGKSRRASMASAVNLTRIPEERTTVSPCATSIPSFRSEESSATPLQWRLAAVDQQAGLPSPSYHGLWT